MKQELFWRIFLRVCLSFPSFSDCITFFNYKSYLKYIHASFSLYYSFPEGNFGSLQKDYLLPEENFGSRKNFFALQRDSWLPWKRLFAAQRRNDSWQGFEIAARQTKHSIAFRWSDTFSGKLWTELFANKFFINEKTAALDSYALKPFELIMKKELTLQSTVLNDLRSQQMANRKFLAWSRANSE